METVIRGISSIAMIGLGVALVAGCGASPSMTAEARESMIGSGSAQERHQLRNVGLAKKRTVLAVLDHDCASCDEAVSFYQEIMALPTMDGENQTFVVIAADGVIPLGMALDSKGFKPHKLTSGPGPVAVLFGDGELPILTVLDQDGDRLGTWRGRLEPEQQEAIMELIRRE